MSFALDVIIKTTMLLIFARLLSAILRRASASVRHAVWASALLAVLVFPLISTLPAVDLAILPQSFGSSAPTGPPAAAPVSIPAIPVSTDVAAPVETSNRWNAARWVVFVWALGFCAVALQTIIAWRELHRLKMGSRFLSGDSWPELLAGAQRELSVLKLVQMRASENPGPLTSGILTPVILLPNSADEWSLSRRRLVLAHEMAHVKRNDALGQVLCQIVCGIYWFNPMVWYAVRRLRLERERACDDYVLGLGESGPDYADHLLEIARGLNSGFAMAAVSMAHPSQLKSRVTAILDSRIRRQRMTKLTTAALLSMTAALTLGLAAIHVTAVSAMPLPAVLAPVRLPAALVPAPPAAATAPKPVSAQAPETPPGYVVNRAPMSYPPQALQKRIEGNVVVELTFNAQGEVIDSHVLSGPEELRQAALQTALQGTYAINVARSLQVVIDFKLPPAGTAQIDGTVGDPSRAPLTAVTITATNTQNGATTVVTTTRAGEYSFPQVPAGTYRLRAELNGFQPQFYDNIRLGNSQHVRLNFTLQPGLDVLSGNPAPLRPPILAPERNYGVLESVDISGLPEPLAGEMRQRLQSFQGQRITNDLLNQVRASIVASSWGTKPVGFDIPRTGASSSILKVTFYDSPPSPTRVRVGGNVMAANLIQQVKPVYPQDAQDAKIQGVVVLEADIGKDGRVFGVRVITGHPVLITPAVEAIKQWVYQPVIVAGQPVDVVTTVTLNFTYQP